jgi:hypothetical protein
MQNPDLMHLTGKRDPDDKNQQAAHVHYCTLYIVHTCMYTTCCTIVAASAQTFLHCIKVSIKSQKASRAISGETKAKNNAALELLTTSCAVYMYVM